MGEGENYQTIDELLAGVLDTFGPGVQVVRWGNRWVLEKVSAPRPDRGAEVVVRRQQVQQQQPTGERLFDDDLRR